MKVITYFLITSMIFCSACSPGSRYAVSEGEITQEELNEKIQDEKGLITFTDGKEQNGSDMVLENDVLYWMETDTDQPNKVPISRVNKITTVKRGKGALMGLTYGALIGGGVGFLFGIGSYSESQSSFVGSPLESGAFGAAVVGIPCAGVGLIGGAIFGHKNDFVFNEQQKFMTIDKGTMVVIEVSSVEAEGDNLIILWRNKEIRLPNSQVKQVKQRDDKIYITLPFEIYKNKFEEH